MTVDQPNDPQPTGKFRSAFQWRIRLPWPGSRRTMPGLLLLPIGVLMTCCLCSTTVLLAPSPTRTPTVAATELVIAATPQPATAMPLPTNTIVSTATTMPTATTRPIATAALPTATRLSPTVTPQPIATIAPTSRPTAAPTATTALQSTGLLPGLQPADIKVNLTQRQMTCSNADKGQQYYVWTCKRDVGSISMRVDFYARSLLTVDYINATVLQTEQADDRAALPLLGFMATMPYDGAEPDKARAWVESTLPTIKQNGDVRSATFGEVPYQLFGGPSSRVLQIGRLP